MVQREVAIARQRRHDARQQSHLPVFRASSTPLDRYLSAPPIDLLQPRAGQISGLASHYLAHQFDLLGSGWVALKHGLVCRGVEGHVYSRETGDSAGLNGANLAEFQRIRILIDASYERIDWHLDFKSGYRWSASTWYLDVPFGHLPGVDIKVPWELARMQHLPMLAWAFGLATAGQVGFAPPATYSREFRNQVLDFIGSNPPRFGVNWRTSMDVAIRLANWLVTFDLFRAYGADFDRPFEDILSRSVYQHALHILGNLEWSPELRGNHYLANIVGLLFAAAYLPRSLETDAWLAFSLQELIGEVGHQFTVDGANFEASTSYHRLSAEMVVYATALGLGLRGDRVAALQSYDHHLVRGQPSLRPAPLRLHALPIGRGTPFPAWYVERLEKMAEFTWHSTKPDGRVPQVGDNDSGRFLKLWPIYRPIRASDARDSYSNLEGYTHPEGAAETYWIADDLDHRHLVAAVNGLFGRTDFAEFATDYAGETWLVQHLSGGVRLPSYRFEGDASAAEQPWMGTASTRLWDPVVGSNAARQRREATIPAPGADLRLDLGLYAYPDFGLFVYRSRRLYLAIRCGPIGQDGNGGHAHNDQLSVELNIDGADLIVDPGTYLYTPLPARRNEYRSAGAHSGPRLGYGEPGALDVGLFRLGDEAHAECLHFGPDRFVGRHRGFGPWVYRMVEVTAAAIHITDSADEDAPRLLPATGVVLPFSPAYGVRFRHVGTTAIQ